MPQIPYKQSHSISARFLSMLSTCTLPVLTMVVITMTSTACKQSETAQADVNANAANGHESAAIKSETTTVAAERVEVDQASVRIMPPGIQITAAFMTLSNASDQPIKLVAAKASSWAETVELHQTTMKDDMMQMQQVPSITVPAQGEVALQSGGYHLMVLGVQKSLEIGQTLPITLLFSDDSVLDIKATVTEIAAH